MGNGRPSRVLLVGLLVTNRGAGTESRPYNVPAGVAPLGNVLLNLGAVLRTVRTIMTWKLSEILMLRYDGDLQ